MSTRRILVIAIAWVTSLLGVGLWAQGAAGQRPQVVQLRPADPKGPVITGENLGFQPVNAGLDKDGRVIGKLMVKVDGEWRETASSMTVYR